MSYSGNLDSEKPIFFESISAAVCGVHSNKVSQEIWHAVPKEVIIYNNELPIFTVLKVPASLSFFL